MQQVGRVTQEFNAVCRSGESDKGVARRQQPRIAVKKDSDRLAEGDALAGADGHCWVTQVVNGVAGGNAVDKIVLTGRAGGSHSDCVRVLGGAFVKARHSEKVRDVGRHSIGPPAVVVDELGEPLSFRGELMIGGMG